MVLFGMGIYMGIGITLEKFFPPKKTQDTAKLVKQHPKDVVNGTKERDEAESRRMKWNEVRRIAISGIFREIVLGTFLHL